MKAFDRIRGANPASASDLLAGTNTNWFRVMKFVGTKIARPQLALLLGAAVGLSGCLGGTTYGTGVTQEKQTLDDVYNMFTLKSERNNIDYSARPDLIVPENSEVLPEPLDAEATTSSPEWPETPEQRIARIQAQAGEIDPRSGDYSMEEQLRVKEGGRIETREVRGQFIPGKTDKDGDQVLYHGEKSQADRESLLARRQELSLSQPGSRRYLSEPPVEYRTPADTAPAGEDAYTEEQLEERRLAAEQQKLKQVGPEVNQSLRSRD